LTDEDENYSTQFKQNFACDKNSADMGKKSEAGRNN